MYEHVVSENQAATLTVVDYLNRYTPEIRPRLMTEANPLEVLFRKTSYGSTKIKDLENFTTVFSQRERIVCIFPQPILIHSRHRRI